MNKLYAPWRSSYLTKPRGKKSDDGSCPFCTAFSQKDSDAKNYILYRTKYSVVMLNLYPYTAGHIMVLPYEHHGVLSDLTLEQRTDMMETVSFSVDIVNEVLQTDGTNVGINLGNAGGGGIPSHLHVHIVPRWSGAGGFMQTIGETQVISRPFDEVYELLLRAFSASRAATVTSSS